MVKVQSGASLLSYDRGRRKQKLGTFAVPMATSASKNGRGRESERGTETMAR